jgi:hypothetical protein
MFRSDTYFVAQSSYIGLNPSHFQLTSYISGGENCITSGSPLCRGLTRAIYIPFIELLRPGRLSQDWTLDLLHCRRPIHRAYATRASQPGIEPGTSCTAGEHSMKRTIQTAYLLAIRDLLVLLLQLPPSRDKGSWLNVLVRLLRTRGEPNACCCVRMASRQGHHYVEAWPSTSYS